MKRRDCRDMILSMSKEELLEAGAIYVKKADQAFEMYESAVVIAANKLYMQLFLERLLDENEGSSYADFYYPVLKPEEQDKFLGGLSEAEREVFDTFETDKGQIYYPADKAGTGFLLEVTARNWLFSTFYFTNKKITVWGNYNLEFPVFCEDRETLAYYMSLAEECGLEIKE